MSGEEIELNDLDNRRQQEEENEETDFGSGLNDMDLLDNLDWLSNKDRNVIDPLNKSCGNRTYEARNIRFFIDDVLLMEEEGITNPGFIKYLMETKDFTFKKKY